MAPHKSSAFLSPPPYDKSENLGAGPSKPAHLDETGVRRSRDLITKSALRDGKSVIVRLTPDAGHELSAQTNHDSVNRAFHLVSCSSGHQADNGVRSRQVMNVYGRSRNAKLRNQAAKKETEIFSGLTMWINGLVDGGISNLEFIEIVHKHGGVIKPVFSKKGCTHMISAKELSASKTHQELSQISSRTRVVHPRWVIDSVAAGHRLPEARYAVLERDWQPGIAHVFVPVTRAQPRTQVSHDRRDDPSAPPPPAGLVGELAWLATQGGVDRRDPNDRPSSAQPRREPA